MHKITLAAEGEKGWGHGKHRKDNGGGLVGGQVFGASRARDSSKATSESQYQLVSVAGTSPQRQCRNKAQGSGWSFKRGRKTHSFSLGNCSTAFWQDRREMNYNEYELSLQSGLRIHLSAHPVRPLGLPHPYSKLKCHQLIALERTWAHSQSKYHKWPHALYSQGNSSWNKEFQVKYNENT